MAVHTPGGREGWRRWRERERERERERVKLTRSPGVSGVGNVPVKLGSVAAKLVKPVPLEPLPLLLLLILCLWHQVLAPVAERV